jgi:hypothetical protein
LFKLITCSYDHSLRILDFTTGQSKQVIDLDIGLDDEEEIQNHLGSSVDVAGMGEWEIWGEFSCSMIKQHEMNHFHPQQATIEVA